MIRWAMALAEVPAGLDAPVVLVVRADAMANFPLAPPGFGGESALRRRALAALAARVLGVHPAPVALSNDDEGRRTLHGQPGVYASVASRDGWVAAALAREPVGCDVESIAEAEAAGPAALDGFDGVLTEWHGAAGAWAAREAALKLAGLGLGDRVAWQFGEDGRLLRDGRPVAIGFHELPGAVAALALSGGNSTRAAPAANSAPAS